jgi:hypothetical protein
MPVKSDIITLVKDLNLLINPYPSDRDIQHVPLMNDLMILND